MEGYSNLCRCAGQAEWKGENVAELRPPLDNLANLPFGKKKESKTVWPSARGEEIVFSLNYTLSQTYSLTAGALCLSKVYNYKEGKGKGGLIQKSGKKKGISKLVVVGRAGVAKVDEKLRAKAQKKGVLTTIPPPKC